MSLVSGDGFEIDFGGMHDQGLTEPTDKRLGRLVG